MSSTRNNQIVIPDPARVEARNGSRRFDTGTSHTLPTTIDGLAASFSMYHPPGCELPAMIKADSTRRRPAIYDQARLVAPPCLPRSDMLNCECRKFRCGDEFSSSTDSLAVK